MDIFEALETRHSYRGDFTDYKLTEKEIEKILKAGISAPIGMGVSTTFYVAVNDSSLIKKLSVAVPNRGLKTAPFVLVLLTMDKSNGSGMNFEIENYSAATENILLAVTAMGFATVWTDGILRMTKVNSSVRRILNIPQEFSIRAVLPIGKPTEKLPPHEKETIENLVIFNRF
jgi:nitroreductase